jgi:hypothetical protein
MVYVVFSMGLNASGQLGVGNFKNTSKPAIVELPCLPSSSISVYSGPLAYHSYVLFSQSTSTHLNATKKKTLPAVDIPALVRAIEKYRLSPSTASHLTAIREMVAESFSSLAVLNSSFRLSTSIRSGSSTPQSMMTFLSPLSSSSSFSPMHMQSSSPVYGGKGSIDLNLHDVRYTYSLLTSIQNDQVNLHTTYPPPFTCIIRIFIQVLATLGRATLLVTDHLKECPFDSPENLSVFLIVLENPLLLAPEKTHVALQRVRILFHFLYPFFLKN